LQKDNYIISLLVPKTFLTWFLHRR